MRNNILFRSIIIIPVLLVVFSFIYGLMALLGGLIPVNAGRNVPTEGEQIYLLNNGYHVALALPRKNYPFTEIFDTPLNLSAQGGYYYFGWGDRKFYLGTPTVRNIDLLLAAKALFVPTPAVLEVSYFAEISSDLPGVSTLYVTEKELSKLYQYINKSIRGSSTTPRQIPQNEIDQNFQGSIFFEAMGSYSLFNTCNNWTSRALKQAGIGTHLWTPFAWGVE